MALGKKKGGETANWMDTYGDMVTLLLCFFVLLYSMSTISKEKWENLVRSFNPDSIPTETKIEQGNMSGPVSDPANAGVPGTVEMTQADIENAIEKIFEAIQEIAQSSEEGSNISVTKGEGSVFISFNDSVFFRGESYELLQVGRDILGSIADEVNSFVDYIDEIRVIGHTAQGTPNRANNISWDRFLSSARAASATAYIQERCTIMPARLVSESHGQWLPVAPNDSSEGRARNRRVEMIISGKDLLNNLGDSVEQYYTTRAGGDEEAAAAIMAETANATTVPTPANPAAGENTSLPG